ncbi:variant surface glycoprotein (VSG), putative, (fragment), partial [Trypanosoma vivax Y486]
RAAGKIDGFIQTSSAHKSQGAGGRNAKAYIGRDGAAVSGGAIAYNARATFTETYLPGCTKATYELGSDNEARKQKLASLLESAATLYAAGGALIDSSDVANGCMLLSGKHDGNNGVYKTQGNALAHGGVLGGMWKVTAGNAGQDLKIEKLAAWTPRSGDDKEDENDDPAKLDAAIEEFDAMTSNSAGTVLQATKRLTQQMREKIAPHKGNQEDEGTEETADVPAMDIEAWLAHLASAAPPNSTATREDTQPKENPQRRIHSEGNSGEKKDAHKGQKLLQQEGHTRAHAASRATKKISAALLSLHAAAAGRR